MVSTQQAYEWVKTGVWSLSEFKKWMSDQLTEAYDEGHVDGYSRGYDEGRD